ncbi:MAG: 50S ribosomal protein L25 [Candidatus Eisenbacteria sp.]|nr:50S ribosomal protein L25 [Candidatus Eisenbacteria bacterium]
MARYSLTGKTREGKGKGAARRTRREGYVPAVLYGEKSENRLLAVEARALTTLLRTAGRGSHLVDLKVEGNPSGNYLTLMKEVQQHPFRGEMLHVDFQRVSLKKKIHLAVPVVLVGEPVGVKTSSGVLELLLRELDIECLPDNIPGQVAVDVSHLDVGQSLHVSDLSIEGVTILNPEEIPVAAVARPTVVEEKVPSEEELEAEAAEGEEAAKEDVAPPESEQPSQSKG